MPGSATVVDTPRLTTASLAVLALACGALAAIMFAGHRAGHWWGDDWALYIRQAQGLLDLDPSSVAAENEFTVSNSRGAAFSPPLYPWGFPAVLAPFVAVVGADVDRLTIVPVLSAIVFALCWFDLVRRRLGPVAGFAALAAVPLSPLLLGWTELIQSEWPFMAVTGVTLVGLDRLVASDRLVGPTVSRRWLVLLGLGAVAAFSVRREGAGLPVAIAAAQLVVFVPAVFERRWTPAEWRAAVARLAVPHAVALAVLLTVQLGMPSTFVPSYQGTRLSNTWRFADDHIDHLAEVVGLKRTWDDHPAVLGSAALGQTILALLGAAAIAGLVLAVGVFRRRDAHLAIYSVAAFAVGGSFRVPINRYVCTVAPILLLLALIAIRAGIGRLGGRSRSARFIAAAVPVVVLASLTLGNLVSAQSRIDRAAEFAAAGHVEFGPTHPASIEMIEAVRRLSDPDDVIAAPKARAMALLAERPTIQVDRYRPIPLGDPPALVVIESQAEAGDELATSAAEDGYELVWSNARYSIFSLTSG